MTPAAGPELQHADAIPPRVIDGKQAAGRLHDEEIAAKALLFEVSLQLRQIFCYTRAHISVGDYGRSSLEFPIFFGRASCEADTKALGGLL